MNSTHTLLLFSLQGSELDPNSLWEDEDTRSFYESITDITPFVPAVSSPSSLIMHSGLEAVASLTPGLKELVINFVLHLGVQVFFLEVVV